MGKLRTPFMYQDKLAGLAESFPLKLRNDASQVISLPVCDIQPADGRPPAVGRFLSSVKSGSLLVQKNNKARSNLEYKSYSSDNGGLVFSITFAQVVDYCWFKWNREYLVPVIKWCTPTGVFLLSITEWVSTFIPFRGRTIYFVNDGYGTANCEIRGFY